ISSLQSLTETVTKNSKRITNNDRKIAQMERSIQVLNRRVDELERGARPRMTQINGVRFLPNDLTETETVVKIGKFVGIDVNVNKVKNVERFQLQVNRHIVKKPTTSCSTDTSQLLTSSSKTSGESTSTESGGGNEAPVTVEFDHESTQRELIDAYRRKGIVYADDINMLLEGSSEREPRSSPKQTWRKINKVLGRVRKPCFIDEIKYENSVHTDDDDEGITSALNAFFTEVGKIAEKFKDHAPINRHGTLRMCANSIFLEPVQECEINELIMRLDGSKGPGVDALHTKDDRIGCHIMESGDTEDNKTNVCPICNRGFPKLAGLRQHVTKGHPQEEIDEEIERRASSNSQPSQQAPSWNKFQIISTNNGNELYHQFDVIETDASGDCLFSAVWEFLKEQCNRFTDVPANQNELRTKSVNFIVASSDNGGAPNFIRFKDTIIANLQHQMLELSNIEVPEGTIRSAYSKYMSTAGVYGTTAELCALAELFEFSYCVIRQNDPENYTCFDYGSTQNMEDRPTLHLLFTGDIRKGHFRYLRPIDKTHLPPIESGKYSLAKEFTSSRTKSIALGHLIQPQTAEQIDSDIITETGNESFEDFVLLLISQPYVPCM
ncbi:hypothetical protein Bhyg_03170, partial [Pseudolycoriella hygida]